MHRQLTLEELEAALAEAGGSPQDDGTLDLIVCRPRQDQRQGMEQADLDLVEGLVGDSWRARGSGRTADGSADPDVQLTLINSRVIQVIAQDRARWPLAGDQLYVDLDLSTDNLPPGQRLAIGTAILEITSVPHTGCQKFTARYGHEAIRFVNSVEGRQARRRGLHARVIQSGTIRTGDRISKIVS